MADGILKVGQITNSAGSGNITIGSGVTLLSNVPAFQAFISSNQTLSDNTQVKIQADTESFDTDNCYDNSTNYRFTPTVAGKYCFYANVRTSAGDDNNASTSGSIYKNGSIAAQLQQHTHISAEAANISAGNMIILEANGSSDYFEFFGLCNDTSGDGEAIGNSYPITYFGGYKIGA
jgi:hypothetical protein